MLESRLVADGFRVLNAGRSIYFPSHGRQGDFHRQFAEINFIDDKTGKPIGINEHIGRRPIVAFGNSDGDLEMLQWTKMGASGPRLGVIVHHTDPVREYAYDRQSHFGKLDKVAT